MTEIIKAAAIAVGIIIVVGLVYSIPIMLLWNWVVVALFDIRVINLKEALGIGMLTSLLFKNTSS